MKNYKIQNPQTLRIPAGATVVTAEEKECLHGGARRPNSIAWRGGNALLGMLFFGAPGLAFFLV